MTGILPRYVLTISAILLLPCLGNAQPVSQPAEAAGLSVIVRSAQETLTQGQPLAFSVILRNVSSHAFALPASEESSKYLARRGLLNTGFPSGCLTVSAEEISTGKRYTGAPALPSGALAEEPKLSADPLGPGEARTALCDLRYFAFVEGDYDYSTAKNALFQKRLFGPPFRQLPPGTYRIRLSIQFIRPDLPPAYNQKLIASYRGSTPLWQGPLLTTVPIQIQIK